jgi:hypothetical protein
MPEEQYDYFEGEWYVSINDGPWERLSEASDPFHQKFYQALLKYDPPTTDEKAQAIADAAAASTQGAETTGFEPQFGEERAPASKQQTAIVAGGRRSDQPPADWPEERVPWRGLFTDAVPASQDANFNPIPAKPATFDENMAASVRAESRTIAKDKAAAAEKEAGQQVERAKGPPRLVDAEPFGFPKGTQLIQYADGSYSKEPYNPPHVTLEQQLTDLINAGKIDEAEEVNFLHKSLNNPRGISAEDAVVLLAGLNLPAQDYERTYNLLVGQGADIVAREKAAPMLARLGSEQARDEKIRQMGEAPATAPVPTDEGRLAIPPMLAQPTAATQPQPLFNRPAPGEKGLEDMFGPETPVRALPSAVDMAELQRQGAVSATGDPNARPPMLQEQNTNGSADYRRQQEALALEGVRIGGEEVNRLQEERRRLPPMLKPRTRRVFR